MHTLRICWVDFSVACMSMYLGPMLGMIVDHRAWSTSVVMGPVVIQHSVFLTALKSPLLLHSLSSYCFLLQECFPTSATWWPLLSADPAFPSPVFVLAAHSQHFISELYVFLCSIVNSSKGGTFSLISVSLCLVSTWLKAGVQWIHTWIDEKRNRVAQWCPGCVLMWRALSRFFPQEKSQKDSRRIKDIVIHLLFFVWVPEYHSYDYFLPFLLVAPFSATQLSQKSCGNESRFPVCPQPSLPCARLIPTVA